MSNGLGSGLSVTVPVVETGPIAPVAPENTNLLAGKYKSVEDLEAGYKALESKLGGDPAKGDAPPPQEPPTDAPKPEQQSAEVTPENVAETLKTKGVDFGKLEMEVVKTGNISEESYKALEAAGYDRKAVDAYLAAHVHPKTAQTQLQVRELVDSVGGQESFNKMSAWAQNALTDAEINAYNEAVSSRNPDMVKFAVSSLKARYDSANGVDPHLIGGAPSRTVAGFASMEQVRQAIADKRYTTDTAYRAEVEAKVARGTHLR